MDSYFVNAKKELERRGLRVHPMLDDIIESEKNGRPITIPEVRWYERLFYRIKAVFTDYLFNKMLYKRMWYRVRHGFDPADAWDLDRVHAKWILPRLKYLRETSMSHPYELTPEEWNNVLDSIIWSFEFYLDELFEYADEEDRFRYGLELFAKYYRNLWD